MDHLHFGHRHPLWHSLVAFVLVLSWSAPSAAQHQNKSSVTISGTPPATVTAGQNYSFIPTVTNPLGHRLVFTIAQMPSWASFNSNTGQLSGTPSSADVATYSGVVITVSSTWQTAQLPPFTIQVLAGTTTTSALPAPTISGTPATSVVAGSAYSFTPSASGPSGMTLSFSVQNLPSWAGFNSATGVLSGTPTSSNVGTYSNIVISVSDGSQSASLAAFSITVVSAPLPAPTISGTPATSVVAGSAYSFTPSASGPSGMTLSYSVQNKPSWANFSIASGQLSGTPTTSNVGTYSNIIISVSDGQASSALPAFNIAVTSPPPTTGSAILNWTIPTLNTDGTPVTDLAGFNIHYGTSASNLNQTLQIASPTQVSYTLNNLAAGTWYFGIVSYTTVNTQSAMSPVVSTTIQ
jgi:hypothetical protein